MPPLRGVTCPECGGLFGHASIAIHAKACAAKRAAASGPCAQCGLLVEHARFSVHMAACKAARTAAREASRRSGACVNVTPEAALRSRLARGSACDACGEMRASIACLRCSALLCSLCSEGLHAAGTARMSHVLFRDESLDRVSKPASSDKGSCADSFSITGADTRVSCAVCGRAFSSDRAADHQLVCQNLATRAAARGSRRAPVTAAAARLRGTDFAVFVAAAACMSTAARGLEGKPVLHPGRCAWRDDRAKLEASGGVSSSRTTTKLPVPALIRRTDPALPLGTSVVVIAPAMTAAAVEGVAAPAPPVATLRYRGPVWGLERGTWLGLEYDQSAGGSGADCASGGSNSGAHAGVVYWHCVEGCGSFVRPKFVRPASSLPVRESPVASTGTPAPPPQQNVLARAPERTTALQHANVAAVTAVAAVRATAPTSALAPSKPPHLPRPSPRSLPAKSQPRVPPQVRLPAPPMSAARAAPAMASTAVRVRGTSCQGVAGSAGASLPTHKKHGGAASIVAASSAALATLSQQKRVPPKRALASPTPNRTAVITPISVVSSPVLQHPLVAPSPQAAQQLPMTSAKPLRTREQDIARSVDFLRVLAGDKARVAPDDEELVRGDTAEPLVPFAGSGRSLRETATGDETRTSKDAKKDTTTQSAVGGEREKRAAAARARMAAQSPQCSN